MVRERQKLIARLSQERQKIGLRSADIGLRPVVWLLMRLALLWLRWILRKLKHLFLSWLQSSRGLKCWCSLSVHDTRPVYRCVTSKIRQQFSTTDIVGER